MLKNITARPITIKQGIKVAVIEAANTVPKMLAPKEIGGVMEAVSKSAQGGINTKDPSAHSSEPEGKSKAEVDQTPLSTEQIKVLLTKIGFGEGTKGWTDEQHNKEASWLHAELFLCWFPCGYLNNTWCPYGHHMASMWKPCGVL